MPPSPASIGAPRSCASTLGPRHVRRVLPLTCDISARPFYEATGRSSRGAIKKPWPSSIRCVRSSGRSGELMKVLFLGQSNNLEPWFGDVVRAVGEGHQVVLWQPGTSGPHLDDVQVVVEQGGGVASRETIDAAADAG